MWAGCFSFVKKNILWLFRFFFYCAGCRADDIAMNVKIQRNLQNISNFHMECMTYFVWSCWNNQFISWRTISLVIRFDFQFRHYSTFNWHISNNFLLTQKHFTDKHFASCLIWFKIFVSWKIILLKLSTGNFTCIICKKYTLMYCTCTCRTNSAVVL